MAQFVTEQLDEIAPRYMDNERGRMLPTVRLGSIHIASSENEKQEAGQCQINFDPSRRSHLADR